MRASRIASSVGFGQVVVGARLESLQHVLGPAARRQHQHRHELLRFAQLADDGEAILARQHDVEDDQVERRRRLAEQPRQRRLAGLDDVGDVAFRLEVEAQAFGEVLLVFDDEDAVPRFVARRKRRLGHASAAFGRRSVNVLPWPWPRLSANARPPCLCATERTMKRPRPLPFARIATLAGMR